MADFGSIFFANMGGGGGHNYFPGKTASEFREIGFKKPFLVLHVIFCSDGVSGSLLDVKKSAVCPL